MGVKDRYNSLLVFHCCVHFRSVTYYRPTPAIKIAVFAAADLVSISRLRCNRYSVLRPRRPNPREIRARPCFYHEDEVCTVGSVHPRFGGVCACECQCVSVPCTAVPLPHYHHHNHNHNHNRPRHRPIEGRAACEATEDPWEAKSKWKYPANIRRRAVTVVPPARMHPSRHHWSS